MKIIWQSLLLLVLNIMKVVQDKQKNTYGVINTQIGQKY